MSSHRTRNTPTAIQIKMGTLKQECQIKQVAQAFQATDDKIIGFSSCFPDSTEYIISPMTPLNTSVDIEADRLLMVLDSIKI